jgi:hypothetical protein
METILDADLRRCKLQDEEINSAQNAIIFFKYKPIYYKYLFCYWRTSFC